MNGRPLSALAALAVLLAHAGSARAQACCAGSGTVTPARLALHESALVGTAVKAGAVLGSFDANGAYVPSPPGASELDLEQDVFGAVHLFRGAQAALLVPLVETHRKSQGRGELGGGVGDLNLSARYDATMAGASSILPGIGLLAGVTFPTGRPPDSGDVGTLATGATGIGAFQLNAGLAVEQAFGPWLVSVSGLVAQRTARTVGSGPTAIHERLGPQWTALATAAYVFPHEIAVAASAAYTVEENATINGATAFGTAHRLPTLTFAASVPISDTCRVQTSLFDQLPLSDLGLNQPASAGASFTVVRSWL
jgi:hypothetical protein